MEISLNNSTHMNSNTATLLITCKDQKGLVSKFSNFLTENGGNIIDADQHSDTVSKLFLTRLEWTLEDFKIPKESILNEFQKYTSDLHLERVNLFFSSPKKKLAVFVSRQDHCLYDLILRCKSNELNAQIVAIFSNHELLREVADLFQIPFYFFPIAPGNKTELEKAELDLLKKLNVDLVVLAKYMQILTKDFLSDFPNVINIHHSFLPAFAGSNPYARAFERGVKIIGATAHYVTPDLDEGPIIEQDVARITHKEKVEDLIRKGRDLERIVLARAVRLHSENRVLVYHNKTVVFE